MLWTFTWAVIDSWTDHQPAIRCHTEGSRNLGLCEIPARADCNLGIHGMAWMARVMLKVPPVQVERHAARSATQGGTPHEQRDRKLQTHPLITIHAKSPIADHLTRVKPHKGIKSRSGNHPQTSPHSLHSSSGPSPKSDDPSVLASGSLFVVRITYIVPIRNLASAAAILWQPKHVCVIRIDSHDPLYMKRRRKQSGPNLG